MTETATVRQRILLVDDDPALLEVLTTVLNLEELDVIPAGAGDTALEIVGRERLDVVICDVGMPDPDGLEVCRRLKADPATADLPVILLTARDTDEDRDRGYAAGCDAYLTKPFSPLELLELIRARTLRDPTVGR